MKNSKPERKKNYGKIRKIWQQKPRVWLLIEWRTVDKSVTGKSNNSFW